jgi:alkanesulfonate monooxygenase SsuD/methylene tetrahydromethanopterin reductase-like flavin-dependent oxidoreductase (luciferase family)
MDLGFVVRPELPPEDLVRHVRAAEAAGFAEVWLWEDCFKGGGIAQVATALAATERVTVGLGIMPAPVRNAAFTAMECALVGRLHPGRFHPGLGHGVADWMRQIAARPKSSMTLLEETTVAVRALLRGETVSTEGRYVRLREVALDHPPARVPPVSLGVVGPKGLELSGRVADGTVLDWLSAPGFVRHARERIDAGRAAEGRTEPHRLTVFLLAAGDEATARREVDARLAVGGEQERFMDVPLEHLAVLPGTERATLAALEAAGADCVVLVSPDPEVPLDAAALAAAVLR